MAKWCSAAPKTVIVGEEVAAYEAALVAGSFGGLVGGANRKLGWTWRAVVGGAVGSYAATKVCE
jgi:hypothetical protein